MAFVVGSGALGFTGFGQFNLGEPLSYDVIDIPRIIARIAFSTKPTEYPPSWIDVSAYLMEAHSRRGRRTELDQVDTGTVKVKLLNDDRRFEPLYNRSPHYPNVKSMRMIQIGVVYKNAYTALFTGYIEGYPQFSVGESHSYVTLDASDGFSVLAGKKINAGYDQHLTGFRINDVLTDSLWPLQQRFVQDGVSLIQLSDLENVTALSHLRLVDKSEGGLMFVAADGDFTFFSRHFRYFFPYTVDQGVFGESLSTGEIPYIQDSAVVESDITRIFNETVYTRVDGEPQTALDATSQSGFFVRTLQSSEDLLNTNDYEMLDRAQYYLSIYKDQRLRITGMRLGATGNEDIDALVYPQMINRELGDRIRVKRLPPNGGTEINQASWIEYIQHDIVRDKDWTTTYNVSPVDERQYWELGSNVYGLLGQTTYLAW